MSRSAQDLRGVLGGVKLVAEALCRQQCDQSKHIWATSSVRDIFEQQLAQSASIVSQVQEQPCEKLRKATQLVQETGERSLVVASGLVRLTEAQLRSLLPAATAGQGQSTIWTATPQTTVSTSTTTSSQQQLAASFDAGNIDVSSITLKELEDFLTERNKNRAVRLRITTNEQQANGPTQLKPTSSMSSQQQPHRPAERSSLSEDTDYVENLMKAVAGSSTSGSGGGSGDGIAQLNVELSKAAKQRAVPSTRLGRKVVFGKLGIGLGIGTLYESLKSGLGLGNAKNMRDALLSPANIERIVDTLCKARGAALKIGQILSIQDSSVVAPELARALERVRQNADYMPDWQVERVLGGQLGADWRAQFASFEPEPFAAASIGQVHRATLHDGRTVAVKLQYPGVADSIQNDIDSLVGMLNFWQLFPRGFFIENVVRVAKRELAWEVDYKREAEYTRRFKQMIAPYTEYYVPEVIESLSSESILTTEFVPGVPLDKCFELSYEHRRHIAASILKLCLRELFEIQCMQTDPNWSNFLYDAKSRRLMLIDFGSARLYPRQFIENYRHVIVCAVKDDRQGVLEMSKQMNFLTGHETKQMQDAHVEAVMILGEMFRFDGEFDFGRQNTTQRIASLVPTMIAHRLTAPPDEIYSIHRKLSGIFLLCARLNVRLNCRPYYEQIVIGNFGKQ